MVFLKNKNKIEISILQTELGRLQGLVQILDKKIAFIFIIYSIIFGFYFNNLIHVKILLSNCVNLILSLLIFLLLVYGFFKIYLTIFPRVNKNEKPLLFFGYIASIKLNNFRKKILGISKDEFKDEVIEQIHTLSIIINKKIKNLKEVIYILIVLIIVSIIYLGINFEVFLGKQYCIN